MAVNAGHISFSINIHAKWLVSLSDFEPFGPFTFGRSRKPVNHFIPIQVSGGLNRKLATRQVEVFCLQLCQPRNAEAKHYILVINIQEVVLSKLHALLSSRGIVLFQPPDYLPSQ